MAYCGSTCGSGSGSSPVFVPYYRGVSSCGLVPAQGIGSGIGFGSRIGSGIISGSGIGSLSGIGSSGGLSSGVSYTAQTPGSDVVIQQSPAVISFSGPSLTTSSEPAGIAYISHSEDQGFFGGAGNGVSEGYFGGALGAYGRQGYGGSRGYSRRYSGPCGYVSYGSCRPC